LKVKQGSTYSYVGDQEQQTDVGDQNNSSMQKQQISVDFPID